MEFPDKEFGATLAFLLRVDTECDRFEAAWLAGKPLVIESVVADWPPHERAELIKELVAIELFHRVRRGERPHALDYLQRFPGIDPSSLSAPPATSKQAETKAGLTGSMISRHTLAHNPDKAGEPFAADDVPIVPGYEIQGELGRGAMGVVYLARQLASDRKVAIKMVLAARRTHANVLTRFKIEAAALARIPHPNIVQVLDCGEADGCPYLALELIEGGTLASRTAGVPQAPRDAAQLIETLARAVHQAHLVGIVHRDLKPANILITAEGECKLSDFGLARFEQDNHLATVDTMLLGTPRYMAPEQAAGQTQVSPAADTYALGVVLYELLTGRPPFQTASLQKLLAAICHQPPIAPSVLTSTIPSELEAICLKCLEKNPESRYVSAEALADDLQNYLSHRPIKARPINAVEKFSRRSLMEKA